MGRTIRSGAAAAIGPRRLALLVAAGAHGLLPSPGAAQIVVVEGDEARLEFTGYVQTVSGAVRAAGMLDEGWAGFHGAVARLAWTATLGDALFVEVHDRFLLSVGSGAGSGAAGLGVSAVPGRTVDLTTELLRGEDLLLLHDFDRLAATVYTGPVDLTVGRQAITWGTASLFPVLDLWGRFSPFELDTQQKPGVDAVRGLLYPGEGRELDLVVADGGEGETVSAAAQLTHGLSWGDVAVGAGKFWEQAMVLAGVTWSRATANLRLEAALPWSLEEDELQDPRITLGVDGLGIRWSWSAEFHLNGIGSSAVSDYRDRFSGDAFARGESYLVGRHYLGGLVSWSPDAENRLRLTGLVQANLDDGSTVWFPSVSYDLGQTSRLILGGLVGVGPSPLLAAGPGGLPVPEVRSEFGSYGRQGYLQVAVFF